MTVGVPFEDVSGVAGNPAVSLPFQPDTTMLAFTVTDVSGASAYASPTIRGQLIGYSIAGQSLSRIEMPQPMVMNLPLSRVVKW